MTRMTNEEFHDALRRLEETRESFGDWLGYTRRTVQRWVSEGPPASVERLLLLILALGFSLRDVDTLVASHEPKSSVLVDLAEEQAQIEEGVGG